MRKSDRIDGRMLIEVLMTWPSSWLVVLMARSRRNIRSKQDQNWPAHFRSTILRSLDTLYSMTISMVVLLGPPLGRCRRPLYAAVPKQTSMHLFTRVHSAISVVLLCYPTQQSLISVTAGGRLRSSILYYRASISVTEVGSGRLHNI